MWSGWSDQWPPSYQLTEWLLPASWLDPDLPRSCLARLNRWKALFLSLLQMNGSAPCFFELTQLFLFWIGHCHNSVKSKVVSFLFDWMGSLLFVWPAVCQLLFGNVQSVFDFVFVCLCLYLSLTGWTMEGSLLFVSALVWEWDDKQHLYSILLFSVWRLLFHHCRWKQMKSSTESLGLISPGC